MKKCKYCIKKNIEDDFCSDDCKNKGERYFNYWKKYKYFFTKPLSCWYNRLKIK